MSLTQAFLAAAVGVAIATVGSIPALSASAATFNFTGSTNPFVFVPPGQVEVDPNRTVSVTGSYTIDDSVLNTVLNGVEFDQRFADTGVSSFSLVVDGNTVFTGTPSSSVVYKVGGDNCEGIDCFFAAEETLQISVQLPGSPNPTFVLLNVTEDSETVANCLNTVCEATYESQTVGFNLRGSTEQEPVTAATIPEPGSVAGLLLVGVIGLGPWFKSRQLKLRSARPGSNQPTDPR